jgi:hypothetical protein
MPQLSKVKVSLHVQAQDLLALDRPLTDAETELVLRQWQEGSVLTHNLAGAWFTPIDLARDFALKVHGRRIIDLCAGIGHLAWASLARSTHRQDHAPPPEIVCVEKNPAYVQVGRKVVPEATWICADVFDLPAMNIGMFDTAIANPPFGHTARSGSGPRYRGRPFEFHIIDLASSLADNGVFFIPQSSAPFEVSGVSERRYVDRPVYTDFRRQTGLSLGCGLAIDTAWYGAWKGIAPRVEIVTCDFAAPDVPPRIGSPCPSPSPADATQDSLW